MKLIVTITFCFISIIAISQDFIGDVKYSVLPPDSFCRYNPQWILMDGGASVRSDTSFVKSRLHNDFKLEKLPDARGVFLRSMNVDRVPSEGDADGNRDIGTYQSDMFKSHDHDIPNGVVGWSNLGNGDVWRITSDDGGSWNNTNVVLKAASKGGNETRPKNITLYVYIKIN